VRPLTSSVNCMMSLARVIVMYDRADRNVFVGRSASIFHD
jgi:hypothetical protein